MKKLISCECSIGIACVELKFSDDSMIAIDTARKSNIAESLAEKFSAASGR